MKVTLFISVSFWAITLTAGGVLYPNDRFIVSFHEVPTNINLWYSKEGALITGNQDIDILNDIYDVIGYTRLFKDISEPLGKHFIFYRSNSSGSMASIIDDYELLDDIDGILPDYFADTLATPNDPCYQGTYLGDSGIRATDAWELNTTGGNIKVGIIDFGVERDNSQLSSSLAINYGEDINHDGIITGADSNGVDDDGNGYIDDFQGWDFYHNDNEISNHPHGTSVTSLVAAITNDSTCNPGIAGGWFPDEPSTLWIPAEILNISHCMAAIEYLGNLGVRVINMSVNFGYIDVDNEEAWIDLMETICIPNDIVLVGGAGNWDAENCVAPARSGYVISVGATQTGQSHNFVRAGFSNYGSLVDIAAPGVNWPTVRYDNCVNFTGTSASSPVVAAAAALILGLDSTKTRDQVKDLLLEWATPVDSLGAGQVNIFYSLAATEAPTAPTLSIQGYSQTHPILKFLFAPYDVNKTVIQRKLVTNDRYHTIYENWTSIDTTNNDSTYIDAEFGHSEDGPFIAYYRTRFIDISDLQSNYSNIVSTEGYSGIFKHTRQPSVQACAFNNSLPAIHMNGEMVYISSWMDGVFAYRITSSGIENTFTLESADQPPQRQIPIEDYYLYAYAGSESFCAFSLSDPLHPSQIQTNFNPGLSDPQVFTVANEYVFQAASHPFGGEGFLEEVFQIIDFHQPGEPQIVFTFSATDGYDGIQAIQGNGDYLITSGQMGLVWDITNPSTPVITDSIGAGALRDIQIWNNLIVSRSDISLTFFSVDDQGRLHDVSDDYNELIANVHYNLLATGDQFIACSDSNQIYVYEGQNDSAPEIVYIWEKSGATGLAVNENHLVVTTNDSLYALSSYVGNDDEPVAVPGLFQIKSIYPNPFNSQTTIQLSLPRPGLLSLKIYDTLGREVESLVSQQIFNAGIQQIKWNAHYAASGLYFVKADYEGQTSIGKLILMK